MKKYLLSVRVLLVLVALVGLGTGVVVLGRRSSYYWDRYLVWSETAAALEIEASECKGFADAYRQLAGRGASVPAGESWAKLISVADAEEAVRRKALAWARKEESKYRRAAYRPWESVTVEDPPQWSP
jgi:hypothetical protein